METLHWEEWESPLGKLTVCCSEKGVRELEMGNGLSRRANRDRSPRLQAGPRVEWIRAGRRSEPGAQQVRRAVAELKEYFSGKRQQFRVPLDLRGTSFQLKVWKALLRIPYGETRSYQQIAREVGNPKASRAVGMANHSNPVGIIVPCHRVISSDGSLGGYGGGLDRKAQLLELERDGRRSGVGR